MSEDKFETRLDRTGEPDVKDQGADSAIEYPELAGLSAGEVRSLLDIVRNKDHMWIEIQTPQRVLSFRPGAIAERSEKGGYNTIFQEPKQKSK